MNNFKNPLKGLNNRMGNLMKSAKQLQSNASRQFNKFQQMPQQFSTLSENLVKQAPSYPTLTPNDFSSAPTLSENLVRQAPSQPTITSNDFNSSAPTLTTNDIQNFTTDTPQPMLYRPQNMVETQPLLQMPQTLPVQQQNYPNQNYPEQSYEDTNYEYNQSQDHTYAWILFIIILCVCIICCFCGIMSSTTWCIICGCILSISACCILYKLSTSQ